MAQYFSLGYSGPQCNARARVDLWPTRKMATPTTSSANTSKAVPTRPTWISFLAACPLSPTGRMAGSSGRRKMEPGAGLMVISFFFFVTTYNSLCRSVARSVGLSHMAFFGVIELFEGRKVQI